MSRLGIDIGGSSVKGALWSNDSWTTAQSSVYAAPERDEIAAAIQSVIEQLGVCDHVGVCLPGRRADDGQSIKHSVNLPALNDWAFAELFESVGLPQSTGVWSDALAAGTDVVRTQRLTGRSACISIGTGVGLAVFDDGSPVGIGSRGIGHLGMISIDDAANLEAVVGAAALRDRFGDAVHEGVGGMLDDDSVIRAMTYAIGIVHAIYVPKHVVLLGGVGLALSQQRDQIQQHVQSSLCPVADPDWQLHFGSSMFHAAMGAARLAQDG